MQGAHLTNYRPSLAPFDDSLGAAAQVRGIMHYQARLPCRSPADLPFCCVLMFFLLFFEEKADYLSACRPSATIFQLFNNFSSRKVIIPQLYDTIPGIENR